MTQPEKAPAPRQTKRDLRPVPRPRALSALGWRPAWLSRPSLPARGHGQGWSPFLPAPRSLPGWQGNWQGTRGPFACGEVGVWARRAGHPGEAAILSVLG